MSQPASFLPEFCDQLALLLQARLPLPESIGSLARALAHGKTRARLEALGQQTAEGRSLADAMRDEPGLFTPYQARLVAAGEQRGLLPEALAELGRFAQADLELVRAVREVLAYPLTIIFLVQVVAVLVLPTMVAGIVSFVAESGPLEGETSGAFRFLSALSAGWGWLLLAPAAFLALIWVLYHDRGTANRVALQVVLRLPGMGALARAADHARLCRMLALCLRQHLPLPEALALGGGLVSHRRVAASLDRWQRACHEGRTFAEALAADRRAEPLLALTVRTAPESALADALDELAGVYEQRAATLRHRAIMGWSFAGLVAAALMVTALYMVGYGGMLRVISRVGDQI